MFVAPLRNPEEKSQGVVKFMVNLGHQSGPLVYWLITSKGRPDEGRHAFLELPHFALADSYVGIDEYFEGSEVGGDALHQLSFPFVEIDESIIFAVEISSREGHPECLRYIVLHHFAIGGKDVNESVRFQLQDQLQVEIGVVRLQVFSCILYDQL